MARSILTGVPPILACLSLMAFGSTNALPTLGTVNQISSFTIPKSPSGMFFDEGESGLLYILCGTNTNGDHYLYTYTTEGDQQCLITIPQAVGMSRVDGFYITHEDGKAYIVDSQGPIYASQGDNYLGGSVYEVEWTNPCGCSSDGTCASTAVTWTPSVTQSWSVSAADVSANEGGGNDEYFRNSGIVVVGDTWFGVNGVHPVGGSLTASYTKSIVQVDKATSTIVNSWSFDGAVLGHDVDMEGLTCGPDQCSSTLYVGDEYNYIYELDLETGDVTMEWDLGSLVGSARVDKGIESLTYASNTGYFYAGIQETAEIHIVSLSAEVSNGTTSTTTALTTSTETMADTSMEPPPNADGATCDTAVYHLSPQGDCRVCPSFCPPECDPSHAAYKTFSTSDECEAAKGEVTTAEVTEEAAVVSLSHDSPSSTSGLSAPTTLSQCIPTDNFPKCAAPLVDPSFKRVRKEIRSLSTDEWDKVVAGMWIMKTESMESGNAQYGEGFRTYDYFVVKHAVATTDTRGDAAHFGAHFITYHSALVLEFENALLAIDPTIRAMPYWDETISAPSVFTEGYFGVDPSSMGSTTNEVTTGKFANWPISQTFSIDDYSPYITDSSMITFNGGMASSSILRGGDNNVTAASATRFGSGSDWEAGAPSIDDWWRCATQDVAEWNDWYTCIEQGRPSFHSGPHGSIGGRALGDNGLRGDFEDPITSPNGPIFMFHHANLDRNRLWWMRKNNREELVCNYYGFPVEDAAFVGPRAGSSGNGAFEGAHLNDVCSSSWGFTAEDLGFDALTETDVAVQRSASTSSLLTHADLVCWLNPEAVMYTYDTNIDCLLDNSQCNSIQGIAELAFEAREDSTAFLEKSSAGPTWSLRLVAAALALSVVYIF